MKSKKCSKLKKMSWSYALENVHYFCQMPGMTRSDRLAGMEEHCKDCLKRLQCLTNKRDGVEPPEGRLVSE